MTEQNTSGANTSTAGLREAALAKRQAGGAATPKAANDNAVPVAANDNARPQQQARPSPTADALADAEARDAKKKLPTKAREEASDADLAAVLEAEPANDGETIEIGGVRVPVEALSSLPDDVLAKIKRKVKAGHKDVEVSLLEALEAVPKAEGWRQRQWEASQHEKKLEAIARQMGSDVIGAYSKLHGVSKAQALEAIAQQYIAAEEYERMDPKAKAEKERLAALEEKARRVEEYERAEKQRELETHTARKREQYLAAIKPAMKAAGLPDSQFAIARVAMLVHSAMEDGTIKGEASADDLRWAAQEVAAEYRAETEQHRPGADASDEDLIAHYGEAEARRIARAYAKRVQRSAAPQPRSNGSAPKPKPTNGEISSVEWSKMQNERMRRKWGGR